MAAPSNSFVRESLATPRRSFLGGAVAAGVSLLAAGEHARSEETAPDPSTNDHRYKIGVCDWMILKRQRLGAFRWTHEIGADGVEVDMGSLGDRDTFESKLFDPVVRKEFLDEAKKYGVEICSLAMSGFFSQSLAERPTAPRMVQDCINTMVLMGVKNSFLPFGVQGDLVKNPELRPAIVGRLKEVAPMAEAAEVIIGVETALDAASELELLQEVGSPAIKSYFNFARPLASDRDLHEELRTLGAANICQIHCTDTDGVWLENNPRIDMPKVKQTLDDMGWSGWLVIERSRDATQVRDVLGNYGANARYMKRVFQQG